MPPAQANLLLVDDNHADIELLSLAWDEAGFGDAISIRSFKKCEEAVKWIDELAVHNAIPIGVVVDRHLFDRSGKTAVDVLTQKRILKGVPFISWSGIEWQEDETARIAKSGVRAWRKPVDWHGYPAFVKRLHDVLMRRSQKSSGRMSAL